jgi:hypothetical protein
MSLVRICVSIPAIVVACAVGSAGLGGCYDLSTSGPRPEDFAREPSASGPQVEEQTEARPASPTALDTSDALLQALDVEPAPENAVQPPR